MNPLERMKAALELRRDVPKPPSNTASTSIATSSSNPLIHHPTAHIQPSIPSAVAYEPQPSPQTAQIPQPRPMQAETASQPILAYDVHAPRFRPATKDIPDQLKTVAQRGREEYWKSTMEKMENDKNERIRTTGRALKGDTVNGVRPQFPLPNRVPKVDRWADVVPVPVNGNGSNGAGSGGITDEGRGNVGEGATTSTISSSGTASATASTPNSAKGIQLVFRVPPGSVGGIPAGETNGGSTVGSPANSDGTSKRKRKAEWVFGYGSHRCILTP
jgi:hypothetical protein